VADPALSTRVTLDDRKLIQLADNQVFVSAFPFLKAVQLLGLQKAGCGRCGHKQTGRKQLEVMNGVKRTIASLPPEQKRRLRDMLKTRQVLVMYRTEGRIQPVKW
jgi:hypothetical protein